MLGSGKDSPREFAALRRYMTGHLSSASAKDAGSGDGFQLDIGLIEAVFDEDFAKKRHAALQGADFEHDFRSRLEQVMLVFADGCRLGLRCADTPTLIAALEKLPALYRAFAYEGAAQGLALRDYRAAQGASRVLEFLRGPAAAYPYLGHMGVGAGPILQRWRRNEEIWNALDPRYRFYAYDGFGFREGYIYRTRRIVAQEEPELPSDYARRMFDRGIARSIWFLHAADADRVIATIKAFPERRHEAMWTGLGFVCVQTGACDAAAAQRLRQACTAHPGAIMEGAAFGAHARGLSGNGDMQCELACAALTGLTQAQAAELVEKCLQERGPGGDPLSLHEEWSAQVRSRVRV